MTTHDDYDDDDADHPHHDVTGRPVRNRIAGRSDTQPSQHCPDFKNIPADCPDCPDYQGNHRPILAISEAYTHFPHTISPTGQHDFLHTLCVLCPAQRHNFPFALAGLG